MIRTALIQNIDAGTVRAYLPANYKARQSGHRDVLVTGIDRAGFSLEYVLDRLASGLIFGHEVGR